MSDSPSIEEILHGIKSAHALTVKEMHGEFARSGRQDLFSLAASDEEDRVLYRSGSLDGSIAKAAADDALGEDNVRALAQLAGVKPFEGMADRVVRYWSSDERVDSYGDIVRQDWIFDRYKENPVAPLQHNWYGPPVGAAIKYEVRNRSESDYTGPSLWTAILFAPQSVSELAESTFRLVSAGFMRCISVGFRPGEVINVTDKDERAKLGLGPYGYVLRRNTLLEQSPVTIPANEGAHVIHDALKRGAIVPSDVAVAREALRVQSLRQAQRSQKKSVASSIEKKWIDFDSDIVRATMLAIGFDPGPSAVRSSVITNPIFDPKEFHRVEAQRTIQIPVSVDLRSDSGEDKSAAIGDALEKIETLSSKIDSLIAQVESGNETVVSISDRVTSICATMADVREMIERVPGVVTESDAEDEHVDTGESAGEVDTPSKTESGSEPSDTDSSTRTGKDGTGRALGAQPQGDDPTSKSLVDHAASLGAALRNHRAS